VRPHPETIKRTPEIVDALAARFEGDERVIVERSVATDESMLRADVLITDWSGIALEYALGTERPVLYVDVPPKVHNDRYEELGIEPFEASMRDETGLVLPASEIPKVDQAIDRLIGARNLYRTRLADLRAKSLFCFGSSSEVGARHILDVVARAESPDGGAI
jgi:YidC/Oxa1 family membrane protein insertase